MQNKKNKNSNKIDREAEFRAGGFHHTYSHQFEKDMNSGKNHFYPEDYPNQRKQGIGNPNPSQWSGNQQEVYPDQHNRENQNKKEFPQNKNYGWKKGFDRNESYGSQLKNHLENKPLKSRSGRSGFGGRNRS